TQGLASVRGAGTRDQCSRLSGTSSRRFPFAPRHRIHGLVHGALRAALSPHCLYRVFRRHPLPRSRTPPHLAQPHPHWSSVRVRDELALPVRRLLPGNVWLSHAHDRSHTGHHRPVLFDCHDTNLVSPIRAALECSELAASSSDGHIYAMVSSDLLLLRRLSQ